MSIVESWNVVVTVRGEAYNEARRFLRDLGQVGVTDYYNVLVMRVDDVDAFLESMREWWAIHLDLPMWLSHVIPLTTTFEFQSVEAFEAAAAEALRQWVPRLAGKRFHVRGHRRGFRHRISERREERLLGESLLEALRAAGTPGAIAFDDPDAIIAVETVGPRGGASLWTREQLARYPFLNLD